MPAEYFRAGDPCSTLVYVCNPGPDEYTNVPLFVILDVYGQYFFAPTFGDFAHYTIDVPTGQQEILVLPEFTWPANVGSASNIIWISAMTDPAITELFGDMDQWTFGWGN